LPLTAGTSRVGTIGRRQSSRYADETTRPLARAGDVHDAAVLVERHVIPFVALESVQRQVVIAARPGQVGELVRLLRIAEPSPRTVAEVEDSVRMAEAADERLGPFEGVVVMFEHHRDAILLEKRHPVLAVLLAGSRSGGLVLRRGGPFHLA